MIFVRGVQSTSKKWFRIVMVVHRAISTAKIENTYLLSFLSSWENFDGGALRFKPSLVSGPAYTHTPTAQVVFFKKDPISRSCFSSNEIGSGSPSSSKEPRNWYSLWLGVSVAIEPRMDAISIKVLPCVAETALTGFRFVSLQQDVILWDWNPDKTCKKGQKRTHPEELFP